MKQNITQKIMAILVIALFATLPVSFAQNHSDNIPEIAEENMRVLASQHGVEMRFEQLKARLDARVDNVEHIITTLENRTQINETTRNELESMKIEFRSIQETLNESPQEAENFVIYLQEVNQISQNFREHVRPHISDEMRLELQERIKQTNQAAKEQRDERISELRRNYNADIVTQNVGNTTGLEISDIAQQLRDGSISIEEFKNGVNQRVSELTPDHVNDMRSQVSENKNRAGIDARERGDEIAENAQERRNAIKETISQRGNEIREELPNRGPNTSPQRGQR